MLTFSLLSTLGVVLSIRATGKSRHRAAVVEIAGRQRTLAERYVKEVLLKRAGAQADPSYTAKLMAQSARALLDGGLAPTVPGDDDDTTLPRATGSEVRQQLEQEERLVADLSATGAALLAGRTDGPIQQTAHEHVGNENGLLRLRVLAALTSNVSLNAARTIGNQTDDNIADLIKLQVGLGLGGLVISLLLGWALIAATRRQTAHFRSLVTSSTDLVLVFGAGGCRYVSHSVSRMLGRPETQILGHGFARFLHPDDRAALQSSSALGEPQQIVFRMLNGFDEWRQLEAHVTDLRTDRHIRGVVLNARDVTDRVRLEEELTHQAFHDGLTGLANRALFRDRLEQALARTERSLEPLAVLLVDLDGFKQVNDSLGHDAGDELLRQVAARFTEITRPGDTLARLGGDEFALLLESGDDVAAIALADRLLEKLNPPLTIADHQLMLSASIGVVVHSSGTATSDDLIRHADLAMYAAKESGRSRYEVFRYDMARDLGELIGLEHELRLGLKRGEFSVHYQSEVDLESRAIVGVEALARWESPTRGLVTAQRFIPVAESTGLIIQLGELVLREACLQTASWRRDGVLPEPFVTWVNISGKQLSGGGVSRVVQDALSEADLPPGFLGLEVTETAIAVGGPTGERARAELEELHELGVRIAIDDFGTGFSSLGHLRRFPVDVIKLDRSFVQGVENDPRDAAITASVAKLASSLGLVAIAEGIESRSQLASVRELGCELGQGFLFAYPVPAAAMTLALASGVVSAGEAPPQAASA